MNKVCGRVVVKEIGIVVPNLLIVVYDLDSETTLKEALDKSNGEYGSEIWQTISGNRIGSVLADENGYFELEYEDSDFQKRPFFSLFQRDKERRPNLALLVVAPEDQKGEEFPEILHVSYGTRGNAGRIEEYAINLPWEVLRRANLQISRIPDSASGIPQVEALLTRMRDLVEEREETGQPEKPFSERYKERVAKLGGNLNEDEVAPQSFEVATPILDPNGEALSSEVTVTYDEESGKFYLKMNEGAEAVPLKLKSVNYANNIKNRGRTNGFALIIDVEKDEMSIMLPRRSPSKLVLQEPEPSDLFSWYTQIRNTNTPAARESDPVDLTPFDVIDREAPA